MLSHREHRSLLLFRLERPHLILKTEAGFDLAGDANITTLAVIWQVIDIENFEIIFLDIKYAQWQDG